MLVILVLAIIWQVLGSHHNPLNVHSFPCAPAQTAV
jgi:hypothetical protein